MDGQALLTEYVRSGSELAFRELVTSYFGLVYSTALRLVSGDSHLAQDVVQMVFTDLARKAHTVSSDVMLGGWLHRRTCNIAAPMMRAERRRQAREKEAVEMNTPQEDSGAVLARITPVLDQAITQLGNDDRTAIVLRFFEHRDFRSIGAALGTTEDAAQKRVTRALEKLHTLLKRQGVALSTAALVTCLGSEALTAAPADLAASIAGTAFTSAGASGANAFPLLKMLTTAKIKAGGPAGTGSLTVTFAGLTNDSSGAVLLQFKATNAYSRRVSFGIGEVQVLQSNNWPNWMRVAGGSNWLGVAAS